MEASSSILSLNSSIPSLPPHWKPPSSLHLHLPSTTPTLSLRRPNRLLRSRFTVRSAVEIITVQEGTTKTEIANSDSDLFRRKLYVVNLPWTFPATSIRDMFAQCGAITQIEMIKDNRGRNKGYAFVTMETPEAAQAAVNKFNLSEVSERVIKVEYAKTLKPQSVPTEPIRETPHKLYASNLQWKVRSNHLRDFFLPDYTPVSARVVFENAPRRSAGYGFVSFATREEADAAVTALNGKELMGRAIILKFSEIKNTESEGQSEDKDNSEALTNDGQNEVPQEQPEVLQEQPEVPQEQLEVS